MREGDASIGAQYFRFDGGASINPGQGQEIRVRNDGYILRYNSRRDLKEQIQNIEPDFAINLIQSLQPVSFRWKTNDYDDPVFAEHTSTYKEFGFIAEDVAAVTPHLASFRTNEGGTGIAPSSWQSNGLISISVSAIKGLIVEINALKDRISALESQP